MAGSNSSAGMDQQVSPKLRNPAENAGGVLHQRSKLAVCPARVALGGIAIAITIGYFTLYSHKKPEATALDVAKVTAGVAGPEHTRPRN